MRPGLRSILALSAMIVPLPATAQTDVLVGGTVGRVTSRQVGSPAAATRERSGVLAGAFLEVQAPVHWLTVTVEWTWVRRGGAFEQAGADRARPQPAAVDYVVLPVLLSFRAGAGRFVVYALAGPAQELEVRRSLPEGLAATVREDRASVLSLRAGVGVGLSVAGWGVRLEARRHHGGTAAFVTDTGDVTHRGSELVLRVGTFRTVGR